MDEGLDFAVKYPFSDSARKHIEGVQLTDRIVGLAVERIKKGIRGDRSARIVFHSSDKQEEIASFAAARMILGHLRNSFLTNRFAVNESKIVRGYIDKADKGDANAVDLVAAQFGIVTRTEAGRMLIGLPAFLMYSPRSLDYRLINMRVINGVVEIDDAKKRKLIEEAVKKHIEAIPVVKDPPDLIKNVGTQLLAEIPKTEIKMNVRAGDHPPCVMRLLESMKKHENLPHHARWYLAAYLLAIGMPEEDVVKLFSAAPDFSEKITAYQVSHIRKKGYSVPACATVMTYGLCCAVCRIGSPINWHTLDNPKKDAINNPKKDGIPNEADK
jgi:DNA primase large subunit